MTDGRRGRTIPLPPDLRGLLLTQVPGYRSFGGVHPYTAALKNLLSHTSVRAPHTGRPFTGAALPDAVPDLRKTKTLLRERAAIESLAKAAA